jgi:HK97 gp10 family phage protein
MNKFKSLVDGSKLISRLTKMSKGTEQQEAIFKELSKGAIMIHSTAVKSIKEVSPGSTDGIRYNPKRMVKVSPAGEPPNSDTGRLQQSIRIAFNKAEGEISVGTDLLYGAWLEYGTLNMRARPWLRPAYRTHIDKIKDLVEKAFKKAVKK